MTEPKRPLLSIKRKPSTLMPPSRQTPAQPTANAKDAQPPAGKPAPKPPAKPEKPKAEPKPQPEKLPRAERLKRNAEKHLRRGNEGIVLLEQLWPALFSAVAPKPLKRGILADVLAALAEQETELSPKRAKEALSVYTQRAGYLEAVAAGGSRFDLAGQPAGDIVEKEQTYSREALAKMQAREGRNAKAE